MKNNRRITELLSVEGYNLRISNGVPYKIATIHNDDVNGYDGFKYANRLADCWNACSEIKNPEALHDVIEALKLVTSTLGYTVPALQNAARNALAKLDGKL